MPATMRWIGGEMQDHRHIDAQVQPLSPAFRTGIARRTCRDRRGRDRRLHRNARGAERAGTRRDTVGSISKSRTRVCRPSEAGHRGAFGELVFAAFAEIIKDPQKTRKRGKPSTSPWTSSGATSGSPHSTLLTARWQTG